MGGRRDIIKASALGVAAVAFMAKAAEAADGRLYVIAELVAKPDQANALRDVMVEFVAGARKEPGCLHYSLLEDNAQKGRFLTFETWTGTAALDAHMVTPEIKAVAPKLATMLEKPFTQIKMSMLSDT